MPDRPSFARRRTLGAGSAVQADRAIEFRDGWISRVVDLGVSRQALFVRITVGVDRPVCRRADVAWQTAALPFGSYLRT